MTGFYTPRERLGLVIDAMTTAAAGNYPIWGAMFAIERALPLLTVEQPPGWREDNVDLLLRVRGLVHQLIPVVTQAVGNRIDMETTALGLASMGAAIESTEATHFAERILYARVLMCRLSILLDQAAIEERGALLVRDVREHLSLMAAPSPSNFFN